MCLYLFLLNKSWKRNESRELRLQVSPQRKPTSPHPGKRACWLWMALELRIPLALCLRRGRVLALLFLVLWETYFAVKRKHNKCAFLLFGSSPLHRCDPYLGLLASHYDYLAFFVVVICHTETLVVVHLELDLFRKLCLQVLYKYCQRPFK